MHVYIYIYIYIYAHTCTCTHACIHAHTHTCACASAHTRTHAHTHTHTRTHTHTHTHTHTRSHTCPCFSNSCTSKFSALRPLPSRSLTQTTQDCHICILYIRFTPTKAVRHLHVQLSECVLNVLLDPIVLFHPSILEGLCIG